MVRQFWKLCAIERGFTARFVTPAELIEDLSAACARGRLREAPNASVQPHGLAVDEVGYLGYGPDAANVLFHVVSERHLRRRPILFTTNKPPLTEWGGVLRDLDLAEAIIDRTLEHGRLIVLDGPSYRTPHMDRGEKNPHENSDSPARFSGKRRPDFPEPTGDKVA